MVKQNQLARKIFGGLSSSYDSVVDVMTLHQDGNWKRKMLGKLSLVQGDRILDVGCGTCVLEEMSQLRSCQTVGIDITATMIRRAKEKRLESISMLGVADAEHLPFREGAFDAVVSCYVLKYCDTGRFVGELGRVLKPGGRMAVYDFTKPRGLAAPLLNLYEAGFMPVLSRIVEPIDHSLAFTCRVLPALIKRTTWDDEFEDALPENNLSEEGSQAPTGGVVTIFWAKR